MCHLLPSQGKKLAKTLTLGPTEAGDREALLEGRGMVNAGNAVEGLCCLGLSGHLLLQGYGFLKDT